MADMDVTQIRGRSIAGLTRGLGVDVSLEDININDVPVTHDIYLCATASNTVGGLNMEPGGKKAFPHDVFLNWLQRAEGYARENPQANNGHPVTHSPGGSTGNSAFNIGLLLRKMGMPFHFTLYTAFNPYADETQLIQQQYREAGIEVADIPLETLSQADIARSIVINPIDGDKAVNRIIIKWPGNAEKILKADLLHEEDLERAQYFLVQGAGWQKFADSKSTYGSALMDKVMTARWRQGEHEPKPLLLALPTDTEYSKEHADVFKWLMGSADYVLGNATELVGVFYHDLEPDFSDIIAGYPKFRKEDGFDVDDATRAVWCEDIEMAAMRELRLHLSTARKNVAERDKRDIYPIAYITCGERGAAMVYPDMHLEIPTFKPQRITNPHAKYVGAGDAAYSGFVLGLLLGLSPYEAAEYGVEMAAAKINHAEGARITNPETQLRDHGFYDKIVQLARDTHWLENGIASPTAA